MSTYNLYDLIIFLGPSQMSKFCKEVAFISNIWDLDHKKNSQFPEHNSNNIYEQKEKLFKEWSKHWDLNKKFLIEKSPPNLFTS